MSFRHTWHIFTSTGSFSVAMTAHAFGLHQGEVSWSYTERQFARQGDPTKVKTRTEMHVHPGTGDRNVDESVHQAYRNIIQKSDYRLDPKAVHNPMERYYGEDTRPRNIFGWEW